jgi:hypothetical protein
LLLPTLLEPGVLFRFDVVIIGLDPGRPLFLGVLDLFNTLFEFFIMIFGEFGNLRLFLLKFELHGETIVCAFLVGLMSHVLPMVQFVGYSL